MINDVSGGSLSGKLDDECPGILLHQQLGKFKPDEPVHKVRIRKGTLLYEIIKEEVIFTNSFHVQAVKKTVLPFMESAHAEDGVVEAIESSGHFFVLGLQFHPEKMPGRIFAQKIWRAFLDAAGEYKRTMKGG